MQFVPDIFGVVSLENGENGQKMLHFLTGWFFSSLEKLNRMPLVSKCNIFQNFSTNLSGYEPKCLITNQNGSEIVVF